MVLSDLQIHTRTIRDALLGQNIFTLPLAIHSLRLFCNATREERLEAAETIIHFLGQDGHASILALADHSDVIDSLLASFETRQSTNQSTNSKDEEAFPPPPVPEVDTKENDSSSPMSSLAMESRSSGRVVKNHDLDKKLPAIAKEDLDKNLPAMAKEQGGDSTRSSIVSLNNRSGGRFHDDRDKKPPALASSSGGPTTGQNLQKKTPPVVTFASSSVRDSEQSLKQKPPPYATMALPPTVRIETTAATSAQTAATTADLLDSSPTSSNSTARMPPPTNLYVRITRYGVSFQCCEFARCGICYIHG